MSRPLTITEQQTLTRLTAEIDTIVARGSRQALIGTTVLTGPGPGTDYATFHRRFALLGTRLRELAGKVVVNESLPASMGANTSITWGPKPVVANIEVTAALVGAVSQTSTSRAITLIHELSHALFESPAHPVKDYAYRSGWAWGYLPAELAESNADTFAEAAALLAEGMQGRPGRYQVFGRVPSQRWTLQKAAAALDLGPALAWVDLIVNRAWIRSNDCVTMAMEDIANAERPKQEAGWLAVPNTAALRQLEVALQDKEIIGARYAGPLTFGLSSGDKATVTKIHAYLTGLKDAVSSLEPVPVAGGQSVTYDAATKVLQVPYAVADKGTVALAELILDALVKGSDAVGPDLSVFTKHRRVIIDWLVANDRPTERAALLTLRGHFTAAPPTHPSPREWASLAIDLQVAALTDITARWTVLVTHATDIAALAATEHDPLKTLDEALAKDVDLAVAIGKQLPGAATEYRRLAVTLFEIGTVATKIFPDRAAQYVNLRKRLEPFM